MIQVCEENSNRLQKCKGSHLLLHVTIAPLGFFRPPIFQIRWNHEGEVEEIEKAPDKQEKLGCDGMAQQVYWDEKKGGQCASHPACRLEPNDLIILILVGQKWCRHAISGLKRGHHSEDGGHAAKNDDEVVNGEGNLSIDRERFTLSQRHD
jgi:hypothetical protein